MKSAILLLLPLLIVSACQTPSGELLPVNTTSSAPKFVPLTPVVQITEYTLQPDGDKVISFNGQAIRLSWRLKNNYAYDDQQRIIQQRTTLRNNVNWWEQLSYQYSTALVERYQNSDNKDYLNTLLLNEKGYLRGNQAPDEYTYDTQGYLIRYQGNGQQDTYTIQEGNVVARETLYSSGGIQRNTYEYDLSKASIPYPITFRGQPSRNLLTKQTLVTTSLTSTASQTTVFTTSYAFDSQGRAIQEVVRADSESSPRSVREFIYQ